MMRRLQALTLTLATLVVFELAAYAEIPEPLQNTCWTAGDNLETVCIQANSVEIRIGREVAANLRDNRPRASLTSRRISVADLRNLAGQVAVLYGAELGKTLDTAKQYSALLYRDRDRKVVFVLVDPNLLLKLEESRADPPSLDRYTPTQPMDRAKPEPGSSPQR